MNKESLYMIVIQNMSLYAGDADQHRSLTLKYHNKYGENSHKEH